jgi:phosphoribosylamine-glycine ligase
LNAVGIGGNLKEAQSNAYKQAALISWRGMQMRTDIGNKVIESNKN